jgi:hypothetical protein
MGLIHVVWVLCERYIGLLLAICWVNNLRTASCNSLYLFALYSLPAYLEGFGLVFVSFSFYSILILGGGNATGRPIA